MHARAFARDPNGEVGGRHVVGKVADGEQARGRIGDPEPAIGVVACSAACRGAATLT
jgi:hypothetical protein